jgi:hypothetical protein
VEAGLADLNAFRGNKMAQLKQAADDLRSQIDTIVTETRSSVAAEIESRKAELLSTAFYDNATPEARHDIEGRVSAMLARVASEGQIALIRQIGSTFESTDYPDLLDRLAASPKDGGDGGPPKKQTVSVKTILVPGVSGVLESEHDVDIYLAALRTALVGTLDDGKRITL